MKEAMIMVCVALICMCINVVGNNYIDSNERIMTRQLDILEDNYQIVGQQFTEEDIKRYEKHTRTKRR